MKAKKKKTQHPNSIRIAWISFACLWGIIILFFTFLSLGWLGKMPSFEQLENPSSNQASEVISADGEILGFIGLENRSDVAHDEISDNVYNALIATEDVRFYKHGGIDGRSLGRVLVKTLIGRHGSSGGGSTISQQLAKNLFTLDGRSRTKSKFGTVYYKFKEWIVAVKLERTYSKDEIITMYLNTVDFGSNAFGIKTAAKTFFGKTPDELNLTDAATLVGLLKAPTAYRPAKWKENELVVNPRSIERRNTVLSQMRRYDLLREAVYDPDSNAYVYHDVDYDSLCAVEYDLRKYKPQSHNEGPATYLREYLRTYMKDWCKHHRKSNGEYYDVHKDGLKVYTTIDSRMQAYAEAAVLEHIGGYIQPAFFKEVARRNGDPFVKMTDEQKDHIMVQSMKNSDRYYWLKQGGMSEKEIRKAFDEPTDMTVFVYRKGKNGKTEAAFLDTVMSPWDSLLYYKKFINAGLVSVEPGTGHVKAYVGGVNFRYFKYDNAQSHRQVGSTFKPFVYTMAIENYGFTPDSVVPVAEVCFETPDGSLYCPKNSGGENPKGDVISLRQGLAGSVNWVSAYLMKAYAGAPAYNAPEVIRFARLMGVKSPIDPVPSICVGAAEVTVMEMAGAMATFANLGEYVEPIIVTKICDNKGTVLETFTPERHTAISQRTAYYIISMMKGVVTGGTGGRLMNTKYPYSIGGYGAAVAGKTGTTQNNSDAWFMGVTPKLATAIWTGGEMRSIHFRSMEYGQGARQAMPIFGYYMRSIYEDKHLNFDRGDFRLPEESADGKGWSAFEDADPDNGFVYEF